MNAEALFDKDFGVDRIGQRGIEPYKQQLWTDGALTVVAVGWWRGETAQTGSTAKRDKIGKIV